MTNDNENKNPTQCDMVLQYLKDFGSITQLEALQDLGIMRLASRVSEINKFNKIIKTEFVYSTNRYGKPIKFAKYSFIIVEDKEGQLCFI